MKNSITRNTLISATPSIVILLLLTPALDFHIIDFP